MAKKISIERLQQNESHLPDFARALDYHLASWLLSPQTKEQLFAEAPQIKEHFPQTKNAIPQMPTEKGSVLVLFERKDHFFPQYIAEGFALPFRWQQDPSDQMRLPEAIHKEAERIRKAVLAHFKPSQKEWYLSLPEELDHLDLSGLSLNAESAGLPLAASLLLAMRDGQPGTTVLSTGAINDEGYLVSVDGYAQKLAAAALLFPSEDKKQRIFFAPPADFLKAKKHAEESGIRLETLQANEPVWKHLEKLLVELDQPPAPDTSLDTHLSYANRQHMTSNSSKRSEHYKQHIVRRLGESKRPERFCYPDRLLLPVSLFPDNAMLSLAALQPKEVCFVTSEESKKRSLDALLAFAEQLGIKVCSDLGHIEIETREVSQDDIQRLADWLKGAKEGGAVVDFTPGTREMIAACILAGLQSHAKLVYARHRFLHNTVEYGTEEFVQIEPPSSL